MIPSYVGSARLAAIENTHMRYKGVDIMGKDHIILYFIFCIIGAGLEWFYGTFWDVVGVTPWIYPNSWLHYTSLEGLPLWGFGGLICVSIYTAVRQRSVRLLSGAAISLVLAALWILLYSSVFQS